MTMIFGETVQDGKVVSMNYVLKNSGGEELDRSESGKPLEYLHGAAQIVPGLESGIKGMRAGEKKKVVVNPAEGYGEINPQLRVQVGREHFPKDMPIEKGMEFTAQMEGGMAVLRIHDINGDMITVDGNHPLAGETLHFDIEIVSVRSATEEELAHGHAHGPDGHHHHA